MNKKYNIHWLEDIIEEISEREVNEQTLATGKTPSGHIHVGILREIIICDALRRIYENKGEKVNFFLFLDNLDAAKRFPNYIDKDFQKKHKGKPFALIPCPYEDCGCESYAHHFGNELTSIFDNFGIKNDIIWTHKLYQKEAMLNKIQIVLENTEKIKEILRKYILPTLDEEKKANFIEMQKIWMPVMAICEKCDRIQSLAKDGSIKPNRVISYDKIKKNVQYQCSTCGYNGALSIKSGRLKLNWRVDWPAKWAIYKTTCEPAGKDHCVKGGSYDTGLELCTKIFDYKGPIKVPYEWVRLGEKDMKTSKGIIFTPKKYLEIADPEIFRMIILRTNPMKHISFRIEELPQYYDYYEKMEDIYFSSNGENNDENKILRYLYPLVQIGKIPDKRRPRIPFKLLIFLAQIQNILSLNKLYDKVKTYMEQQNFKTIIKIEEFGKLLKQTENWLEEVKKIIESEKNPKIKQSIIRKNGIFTIPDKIDKNILDKLVEIQIKGISSFRNYLIMNKKWDAESITTKVKSIATKDLNISPRKLFEAIYLIILGRKSGPKLGTFITMLDKEWFLDRLNIE